MGAGDLVPRSRDALLHGSATVPGALLTGRLGPPALLAPRTVAAVAPGRQGAATRPSAGAVRSSASGGAVSVWLFHPLRAPPVHTATAETLAGLPADGAQSEETAACDHAVVAVG